MDTKKLWIILDDYVKNECKEVDDSHGYEHMKTVALTSLSIVTEKHPGETELAYLTIIVAWLHDIADHKYDKTGILKEKLKKYLLELDKKNAKFIMDIIERVSFSKEDKILKSGKKLDWQEVLGEKGILIRDIVSDADKLEALGKIGVERCIGFTKERYREEEGKEIEEEELIKRVHKHAKEKLIRLKDEFIITKRGKILAEPLHNEMIEELKTRFNIDFSSWSSSFYNEINELK